jgi:hypothetical protein
MEMLAKSIGSSDPKKAKAPIGLTVSSGRRSRTCGLSTKVILATH